MSIFDIFRRKSKADTADKRQSNIDDKPLPKIKENTKATIVVDGVEIPTLESLISAAYPSKNGLYPHEIMMLDYANSYNERDNTFQNFWKWRYSVLKPQEVLDSLYERGFIRLENIEEALQRTAVAKLKEMLAQNGEKTTGKKGELIKRIIDVYAENDLNILINDKRYVLTEKGAEELKQNEYVPYLHRRQIADVWDINKKLYSNNPAHLRFRDIIWKELNERSGEHFRNFNFGSYRSVRLEMHNFLLEECKYKTAFSLLCEVISFDLSGLGNNHEFDPKDAYIRRLMSEHRVSNFDRTVDKKEIILPPGIIRAFEALYKNMEMQKDEFIRYTYEQFSEVKIAERVFTEEECANFALAALGLEEIKITNSFAEAQKRLKEMYEIE